VLHGGQEVARHRLCQGRRQRCLDAAHLIGLVGGPRPDEAPSALATPALLRPLAEYEALTGGRW
jgi:hypothetical protein